MRVIETTEASLKQKKALIFSKDSTMKFKNPLNQSKNKIKKI